MISTVNYSNHKVNNNENKSWKLEQQVTDVSAKAGHGEWVMWERIGNTSWKEDIDGGTGSENLVCLKYSYE